MTKPGGGSQKRKIAPEDLPRILDRKIGRILGRLHSAGIPVWVVGGVVRDALMGRSFRDVDLLVQSSPNLLSELLPEGMWVGKVIPALILSPKKSRRGTKIQITTFSGSLEREISRRDFSVNALAMRLEREPEKKAEILDFYGGISDLSRRILRRPCLVRDPFSEDPIRILRMVRFVSTLGFSVEPETSDLAKRSIEGLSGVAVERLRQEALSLFSGAYLRDLSEVFPGDLLREILGRSLGIYPSPSLWRDRLPFLLSDSARFSKTDPLFRLWILLEDSPIEFKKMIHALSWSRAEKRRLLHFERLSHFFEKGPKEGPWSTSDRSLLLNPDRRETIRRRVERRLESQKRRKFKKWSQEVVSDLCRPWSEVQEFLMESMEKKS